MVEPVQQAVSDETALVAACRAELAGRQRPLDLISREELLRAGAEFAAMPEVAGESLTPKGKRARVG